MGLFKKRRIDPDDGKPEVQWLTIYAPSGRQLATKVFNPPVRGIQAAIGIALAAARDAEQSAEQRGEVLEPKVEADGYWPVDL